MPLLGTPLGLLANPAPLQLARLAAGGQWVTLVSAIAAHSTPQPLQFLPLPHLLPPLQLCLVGRKGSGWRQLHGAWVDAIVASVQSVAWPASVSRL